MDAFICKDGKLVIFHGHVQQYRIPELGMVHLQRPEYFCSPIERIYKFAATLNIYTDLPTRSLFGFFDRLNNIFVLLIGEEPSFFEGGK